jgi:catechol 2,3-dioxygenase-like lactoylglutathione lyase family enzyme
MQLTDLQHVAIRTADLAATDRFYIDILGMRRADRPPFGFPGSWLAMGSTMIHVMAGDAAKDDTGQVPTGAAAVDHLALGARGFDAYKAKFIAEGLDWRENDIPSAGLWQLFVKDPSGIVIELNFDTAGEPAGSKGVEKGFGGDMVRF